MKKHRGRVITLISTTLGLAALFLAVSISAGYNPKIIGELAFDVSRGYVDNTIYIWEGRELVPYLVLTANYHGDNTLLLRKEALPEKVQLGKYEAYYPAFYVCDYLNGEFADSIKADIVEVTIPVVNKKQTDIEYVRQKVFLPSAAELGIETEIQEGWKMNFFTDNKNLITTTSFATRSPTLDHPAAVISVSTDSSTFETFAFDKQYIRPAFCVSSSTFITKKQISDELTIFMIE